MSAVEAPEVPVDVPASTAEAKPARPERPPRPVYTRSEDVIIPPKPEKVSAPNEEEFKKRVAEIEAQIEATRKRVESIRGSFTKGVTKDAAAAERTTAREKLQAAQKITRAKNDELNAERAKLKEAQKARDAVIAEETKLKTSMKVTDVRAIDRKISEIDERITTETLSLPEEKKLIAEREQLQASKPLVAALQKKQEEIAEKKKAISAIYDRVKAVSEEFNQLKDQEKLLRDEFESLKAKQAESAKEQPSIADELKSAKEKRDLLIASVHALRDEHGKQMRAYRSYERALRDHQMAKRQKEYLERQEEYKSREESRKAEEASFDPLAAKRELCLTLVNALERMQPAAQKTEEQQQPQAGSDRLTQLDGKTFVLMPSKKFVPEPVRKGPKGGQKAKSASEPLRLPLALIHQFSELHLSPPTTTAAIPTALQQLKEKAAFFETESAAAAKKAAEAKEAAAAAGVTAPAAAPAEDVPTPPASAPDVSEA